jgi:hypothetical protein
MTEFRTNIRTIDYTAIDYTANDYTVNNYTTIGYASDSSSDGSSDGSGDNGNEDSPHELVPIPPRKYNFSPLLDCMIKRRMGSGVCNSSHIAVITSSFEKSQWYLLHVKGKNRGGGEF